MEYPLVYAPWMCSTSCSMYCTTLGIYRNGQVFVFAEDISHFVGHVVTSALGLRTRVGP